MTIALPGTNGSYACPSGTEDPHIHQELMEMLYHMLWETVHVFLERRQLGHEVGESAFLYPFLGSQTQDSSDLSVDVAASILTKVEEDSKLRSQIANQQSDVIRDIVLAISDRLRIGGKLLLFGNGGSATDANDWAIDCISPEQGYHPIPAISLSMEPANITAIANDIGADAVFLRQLIAHGRSEDVAIGISTSGGSRNIILALQEARRRGMLTVALLGTGGGEIHRQRLADFDVVIPSDYIPRIQEVQASVYHIVREILEEELYAEA
jgi:D-sedoheptulose 7-phosphate isomerase